MRCADDILHARERASGSFRPENLRNPEVGDLHPCLFVEQDVLGFDVAMDDAPLVGELQRLAYLRHNGQRLLGRDSPGLQQLAQRQPIHILHEEVMVTTCFSEVVNRDDVRVIEPGQGAGFLLKARGEFRVRDASVPAASQNLQRHETVELRLARFIDRAHAAAAQALEDFKLRKVRRDVLHLWSGRRGWLAHNSAVGTNLAGFDQPGFEQALRANPLERRRWHGSTAKRANGFGRNHLPSPFTKDSRIRGYTPSGIPHPVSTPPRSYDSGI
jgi:hypothetical protein